MGSWWDGAAVEAFVAQLAGDVLLCLDEAYADFAPAGALPPIDPDDTRVLRFRTFSKAHGMAGLRIGYALGAPEVVAAFDRVRNHFGVNRVAQAGALASLADDDHIASVVARVAAARARIGRDRGGQRPRGAAVGHQLRDGRLRARRRLRATRAGRAGRARRLHPHARRCAARPLRPHQHRARRPARRAGPGAARRPRGGGRLMSADHVDRVVEQWAVERPDLDASPIRIIGRVSRLSRGIDRQLKAVFDRHGIEAWEYDVLAALAAPERRSS